MIALKVKGLILGQNREIAKDVKSFTTAALADARHL